MKFYQFALAGLAGAAVLAALFYFAAESSAARLDGEILNVRTLATDQRSSVAIVDFRATNNSDVLFVSDVRKMFVVDENGLRLEGKVTSAFDLKQLFKYFTALGKIEREPFTADIELPPGDLVEGILAARFEIPKSRLDARREIILHIEDADGSVTELSLESEPEPESAE